MLFVLKFLYKQTKPLFQATKIWRLLFIFGKYNVCEIIKFNLLIYNFLRLTVNLFILCCYSGFIKNIYIGKFWGIIFFVPLKIKKKFFLNTHSLVSLHNKNKNKNASNFRFVVETTATTSLAKGSFLFSVSQKMFHI